MWIVLFLLSAFMLTSAIFTLQLLAAQALGSAMLVAAAVLFVGAATVEAINSRAHEILKRLPEPAPKKTRPYSEDLIA